MSVKEKVEDIIRRTGAEVMYRESLPDGEVMITDAYSPYPHEKHARFIKNIGISEDMAKEFPTGAWVTIWWIFLGQYREPCGALLFDPASDKNERKYKAMDQAAVMLNTVRKANARLH